MANRSNEADEYHQDNATSSHHQLSPGFEESRERVVRRSDLIALERKIPMRRSSTGATTTKPLLVQGKVKRKRRPPKIPWKKPAGMPKRPLSAYNLFFAYERERLLKEATPDKEPKSSPEKMDVDADVEAPPKTELSSNDDADQAKVSPTAGRKSGRRHTRTSGIGFANLAKTIASAWNTLDDENRAIFVGRAAREKERYQGEMLIWRAKQQKAKSESAEEEAKAKASTTTPPKPPKVVLKRRQSSPPDAQASAMVPEPKPDSPTLSLRRASEPIVLSPSFAFSFDKAISPHGGSESSSWAEPMDGASLGSADGHQQDWETTLSFDLSSGSSGRPTPRRSYSDSMLQIRSDHYDVRPCEELAADLGGPRVAARREETKDSATHSSLQALKRSLDDDMVDFITTLSKSEG